MKEIRLKTGRPTYRDTDPNVKTSYANKRSLTPYPFDPREKNSEAKKLFENLPRPKKPPGKK